VGVPVTVVLCPCCRCAMQTGSYRERYKSPSYQIKEGECVNIDVTGPGATIALGLMFFNTNNRYEVMQYCYWPF